MTQIEFESTVTIKNVDIDCIVYAELSKPYRYSGDYGSSGEMCDVEDLKVFAGNNRIDITGKVSKEQLSNLEQKAVEIE